MKRIKYTADSRDEEKKIKSKQQRLREEYQEQITEMMRRKYSAENRDEEKKTKSRQQR
jgi:hypothetical protein